MIKLISFDIGGTLVVASKKSNFYKEFKNFLEGLNIDSDMAIRSLKLNDYSVESFCACFGIDCPNIINEIVLNAKIKHDLFDDVIETLEILKNKYKLITISNAVSIKNIMLEEYGISRYFDLELYSYNYNSLKPDVKMFEYAMKEFGIKPEECMHIGDNKNDVLGANNNGWISVFLNRNSRELPELLVPTYSIHTLKEILQIVDEI